MFQIICLTIRIEILDLRRLLKLCCQLCQQQTQISQYRTLKLYQSVYRPELLGPSTYKSGSFDVFSPISLFDADQRSTVGYLSNFCLKSNVTKTFSILVETILSCFTIRYTILKAFFFEFLHFNLLMSFPRIMQNIRFRYLFSLI